MGGLSCGVILAKNGYDVTVLEQATQTGGCLQCFTRRGARFETGMHFLGSASEGQTLDRLLRYLEVRPDIQLAPLDLQGYAVVCLDGKHYRFANGRHAFIQQMSSYFPHQHEQLIRYFDTVEKVARASSLHTMTNTLSDDAVSTQYQLRSVNEVIDSIITDPLLAKVLAGTLPLYAAQKDKTPFATHAFIMDFYNQSAYRVVGGSDAIAQSMANTIHRYGGQVVTRSKVTRIVCDDSHATGVEINGSHYMPADIIISDAHPMRTLELTDSKLLRPAFRSRINAIPQTTGCFTLYLDFKENAVPYQNYNFFGYNTDTPWACEHYDETSWPKGYLYMHTCHKPNPAYAKTAQIISYMNIDELRQWQDTTPGHRGQDYEDFKRHKAERLLNAVEQHFPGLRASISHYYTSTPLTYRDYTGTEGGSMYGVARDIQLGTASRVPHRTKIPNLFQTGQNINSHGILGVMVGTIVTCSTLLPPERIYQQIMNCEL